MRFENIDDPIEVIALFRGGKLRPIKFRWKDWVLKVERVNGGWVSDEGRARFYHYSVMCSGPDVYEISYNSEKFNWRIDRVCMEG